MDKMYYTMRETSEILEVPDTTVRFWSDSFPRFVKPRRNAKGNRMFTPSDIEMLKQIRFLVKDKGLTLDGVARQLSTERSGVDRTVRAIDCLKDIRERLIEVRKSL